MQKKIQFKNVLFASCFAVAGIVGLAGCEKDDDDNNPDQNNYTVSGAASGGQEVPAVTTSATGNMTGTYNRESNSLSYNITWTGLSSDASMAHFHGPAAAGVNADVLVPITITTNGINGTATATVVIEESMETALMNGQVYYNIHTPANPAGEIRGQVTAVVVN